MLAANVVWGAVSTVVGDQWSIAAIRPAPECS